MSDTSSWIRETPSWVWLAFFPTLGGLAIAYAGAKIRNNKWIFLGLGCFVGSLLFSSIEGAVILLWLAQIGMAFNFRHDFIKLSGSRIAGASDFVSKTIRASSQIDINECSKDELVRLLNIPIVYANNIEFAKKEGFIFTYLEELVDVAGLPSSYLNKLKTAIIFRYDLKKEGDVSWYRFNSFTTEQLSQCGIGSEYAKLIVADREKRGSFSSVVDVIRRTGIPLKECEKIL